MDGPKLDGASGIAERGDDAEGRHMNMLDVQESDGNAVIDPTAILERFDSDIALLREVSQLFLDDCPHRLAEMRHALAGRDCKAVADVTHSLRGSLGNFGARLAIDAAWRLERCARSGDLSEADEACAALEREVLRVELALKALL